MNILVTGSKGQLGHCIRNSAVKSENHYIFTDVDELDITDSAAVADAVDSNDIDVIINCAAYTDVEKAERDFEKAEKLNGVAVSNLASAIKQRGGTLIHISTDYVFGGSTVNTPLTESEPTNPTGVYGLTKLHGEEAIRDSGCKALVFRTAWLYSEYGRNFVKTMLNLTATKPELKVVLDQVGTPTYAQDLADAVVGIVDSRAYQGVEGVYHFSNEGVCSWFDFAKAIAEIAGHTGCDIQPCHTDEFPSAVVRPTYSVLDKTKFKERFNRKIPYWIDSLRKCIINLKEE